MKTRHWVFAGSILLLVAAGLAWAFKPVAAQWVHVPEPKDEDAQFFYERTLSTPNNLVQRRSVLVNYKDRTERNEASMVYDFEFDCFTDRYQAQSAKSYFSANGKGEVIREFVKDRLGMAGGFGVRAVQRELCSKVLGKLSGQEPYVIGMWDFPLHSFIDCKHHRSKDNQSFLQNIRKNVKPIEQGDGAFKWKARGETGGYEINLPVSAVSLGVCNASGDSDCGAASFIALHVSWPLDIAKARLKQYRRNGKDFTQESRDAESGATLRAVLATDPKNPQASVLYCDSGGV